MKTEYIKQSIKDKFNDLNEEQKKEISNKIDEIHSTVKQLEQKYRGCLNILVLSDSTENNSLDFNSFITSGGGDLRFHETIGLKLLKSASIAKATNIN